MSTRFFVSISLWLNGKINRSPFVYMLNSIEYQYINFNSLNLLYNPFFSTIISLHLSGKTLWSSIKGHSSSVIRLSSVTLHPFSFLVLLFFLFFNTNITGQENPYLYHVNSYPFIRYDLNKLHHFDDEQYAEHFYSKLESLVQKGQGRINVVHIGGSHIQAGTFSGRLRTRLQKLNGEMNAGWGYMFPYRVLKTNTPFGYFIRYKGKWKSCRNVEKKKTDPLGVGGISVSTSSSSAAFTILLEDENELDYSFNKIRIFYDNPDNNFSIAIDSSLILNSKYTNEYVDFELNTMVDSLRIRIGRENNSEGTFTLFGISTERAANGFLYHSIGVNGAHVPAFLRCQLFEKQLGQLKPDLVILSLGINDAYGSRFSPERFENSYAELISKIRRAAPETAIIFTTNNDSYMYRRYVNKNGEKVKQSMLKMALEHKAGVWDMYSVMGGLNSVVLWEKNELAKPDKIHFTREGYLILGDLFFNALIQGFEKYVLANKEVSAIERGSANKETRFITEKSETCATSEKYSCFRIQDPGDKSLMKITNF